MKDELNYQICSKTVLDTTVPDISFNENGECNFCDYYQALADRTINRDPATKRKEFDKVVGIIKQEGKGKEYDCVLGVSGGLDSTYLALLAKEEGLRPLLVHFDNGWNSELAVKNIENIVNILEYKLHTYVMDWEEFKDLQRSYLKASVVDVEVPTDQLIFAALNKIAFKYKIKFILAGNNVATESINPAGWVYKNKLDLINLKSIHKAFGSRKLKKLPRLGQYERYFYEVIAGIQRVNILDLIDYKKADVKKLVEEKLHWKDYGGKHYESIFTRFYQGYYLPVKFGFDKRRAHLSNLILSGQLTREAAIRQLIEPTYSQSEKDTDLDYVVKKLGFAKHEWEQIMTASEVSHEDYETENDAKHKVLFVLFRLAMFVPIRVLRFLGILYMPIKIDTRW
ncbi:MAG: N-acetyl sugar amidotransferase [Cyclobacteriaceae bacterium]|nr:N-acetyl sugar amidotransferase [Cyclobacteriaceae bacterium]